jgi:hypothetical protein
MSEAMLDGITQVIESLKPAQRKKLINRLIASHVLSEDEQDLLLIEQRRHEPLIPYSTIRKELVKKGRLK